MVDPAGQLASGSVSNDAYAWTGHVNVDRDYVSNGLNQYTSAGPASFSYDANGNLISDGTTSYVYDVENRLISVSGGSNSGALRYDPLGRLYEVTAQGATTHLLYDGADLVGEYDPSATLLRHYVHSADPKAALRQAQGNRPIAWYEGSGFTATDERRLRSDWQGSGARTVPLT